MIKLKPLSNNISYETLKTLISGLPSVQATSSSEQDPSWSYTLTAPADLNLNPSAFPTNVLPLFRVLGTYTVGWHTATLELTNNTPYTLYIKQLWRNVVETLDPGATGSFSDVAHSYTENAGLLVYFGNPANALQTYSVVSPLTF